MLYVKTGLFFLSPAPVGRLSTPAVAKAMARQAENAEKRIIFGLIR